MAAEIANEQEMVAETIGYEEVIATLENLDVKELAAILERGSTLLKKAIGKGPSKKKGTGVVPPQLEQNHEWVKYVLGDAKLNGWESFEMRTTKMDKSSGEKHVEVVTMAGSVEKEGVHVFEDTEKEFTQKDAMSYSKLLKDRNDELYQAFLEDYSSQMGPKKEAAKVVKKTSEELEREKEEKKAEKEREKAEKAAEKEREKEEKKAEKEREKEEKKAEKEREKAEKAKEKKPEKKMLLVPVKRERSASPVPATAATLATPAKKIVVKKPAAPVKAPRQEEEDEEEELELDD
jgi:chromatin assembly factor 1 subunit A